MRFVGDRDSLVKDTLVPLEVSSRTKPFSLYREVKRWMDTAVAAVGLVLAAPIILLFAVLIKLESPGPVLFAQERMGRNGKVFHIYKLRSMVKDAEKNGAQWAEKNDARVTKVGKFIRKTRIDELPQFINVIRGEMSIIGPRPERPLFVEQFNREIPGFVNRLQVKPGITGWAQVNGGYELTAREKLELDMEYINNYSFWMDLKIVWRTIKVVLTGDGAR